MPARHLGDYTWLAYPEVLPGGKGPSCGFLTQAAAVTAVTERPCPVANLQRFAELGLAQGTFQPQLGWIPVPLEGPIAMTSTPTPDGDASFPQGGGAWHAEAAAAGGRLTFLFDREPSRDVVVTVASEPGATFTVPEIRRLHAALGNVFAQLD